MYTEKKVLPRGSEVELHPNIIMQIHKNFCFEELAGGKKQCEISI